MAKLINLQGATVTVPAGWSCPAGYGQFTLTGSFSADNQIYDLYEEESNVMIGYSYAADDHIKNVLSIYVSSKFSTMTDFLPSSSLTFNITGGTDVTRSELIEWFVNNATIEGGVWEEEKAPILIKNPLIIFNKTEQVSGTPIEISSLDNALLIAENEGKIYKFEEKLYKIELGNLIPTDLTGYTIHIPEEWSAKAQYGIFSLNFSPIESPEVVFDILRVGYHFGEPGGAINNVSAYSTVLDYGFLISDGKLIEVVCTGGTDATNENLINWLVENNTEFYFEGEKQTSYNFKEVLSPEGNLFIEVEKWNRIYDVRDKQYVSLYTEGLSEEFIGVPISKSELREEYLIADNEGKVYEVKNKLYRIVLKEGVLPEVPTTINGYEIYVPAGWSCPAGYGSYFIDKAYLIAYDAEGNAFNLQVPDYRFDIGYDFEFMGGTPAENSICHTEHLGGGAEDGPGEIITPEYAFKLSGTYYDEEELGQSSEASLIQWFIDNNATFTYIGEPTSSYVFEEILSPNGTLDITANGEVDVKTYEKVNVNISSDITEEEVEEMINAALEQVLEGDC